jgi:hypothetical protein
MKTWFFTFDNIKGCAEAYVSGQKHVAACNLMKTLSPGEKEALKEEMSADQGDGVFISWGGMGFHLEAASPGLRAAILAARPA